MTEKPDNKCAKGESKYEAYFIFRDEKELLKHIEICPECKAQQDKMDKVSELISEVRPYFLKQKRQKNKIKRTLKAACFTFALVLFAFCATGLNYQYDIVNSIVYHNLNAQELGFPTDEYGLIMVE